jgi:hypothetical protein
MATAATSSLSMITETSFIIKNTRPADPILLLKNEAIDRLASVVDDLPKYQTNFKALIADFAVDTMLQLINTIYRDSDFTCLTHCQVYNEYFDEIEELIYKYIIS